MKEEIIIAGFGGQGVLSMGKILAYSGLMEGKEVSWMPAYGPEQRGGTANVTVIVSDDKISSPILSKYDTAIILNQPSLEKFESRVKPGGILIYDDPSQDTHAGGSGCGCSAVVLASYILPKIVSGEWKRILFVPTGALLSKVSFNEGDSIPGIAHGVVIEHMEV